MKQLARITGLGAVAALCLVGCGDDGGTSSAPSNADQIVATFEDLAVCTAKREGASAYVRDEKTEYVCTGGDWIPASDAPSSQGGSSVSSGGAPDGSSSSGDIDSTAYEEVPVVAVKNKTITGVSQKGPFVNGASVTVQELDGKTLAQTGKSFKGKISGDNGEFSVSSVTLVSQYALLEANGFYQNEVTGRNSNAAITLNALVDLSKRENVNINLLTHLEYERALYLTTTGMNVPAAKKQAEREIFEAFRITGDFASSEELNILSTGAGDAALLAISVLMQSNLSEANLSERLANFASDIEEDGKWNDETTKATMADWASTANLANIGANVQALSANNKVPAFEQAVKNFWWNNYGLGSCSAANPGEIKQDTNSLSGYHDTYFFCDTSIANWRRATVMEYDTYLKSCSNSANLVSGAVVEANKYVCDAGSFRAATASEKTNGRGCTSYNLGEERLVAGYMQCSSSGAWSVGRTVSGTLTDARDGNRQYATIGIGTQMWMAENLNFVYKVNGASYGSYCYANSADSCAKYGKLYTWGAAMDSATTGCGYGKRCDADTGRVQGVCPNGWHLPSQAEWQTLFTAVGGQSTAGKELKATSGWYIGAGWDYTGGGPDDFGFSALPSGYRVRYDFTTVGRNAYFWSSSEYVADYAWCMYLSYDRVQAYLDDHRDKYNGNAVRCLRD